MPIGLYDFYPDNYNNTNVIILSHTIFHKLLENENTIFKAALECSYLNNEYNNKYSLLY